MSASGSGRTCPRTVIAFGPSCQCSVRPLGVRRTGSSLDPTSASCIGAPGFTGSGVHSGQGSLPPRDGGGVLADQVGAVELGGPPPRLWEIVVAILLGVCHWHLQCPIVANLNVQGGALTKVSFMYTAMPKKKLTFFWQQHNPHFAKPVLYFLVYPLSFFFFKNENTPYF